MDPLFMIAGVAFGLAYVLNRHRPRVRLSDAHTARRQRIVESWQQRDRAAIAKAQHEASVHHIYGPLTEAQQGAYREVRERLDDLREAA